MWTLRSSDELWRTSRQSETAAAAAAAVSVVFPAHEPLDVRNGHCAALARVHQLFLAGSCPLRGTRERGLG